MTNHHYEVTLSNTFEASSPEQAAQQMLEWLQDAVPNYINASDLEVAEQEEVLEVAPERPSYTDWDRSRRRATQAANLDFLADQAKLASDGFFTVEADEDYRWVSLRRTDGKPLGEHVSIGAEISPTTGQGLPRGIISEYRRLNRRDRRTLKDLSNAIRTVLWSDDRHEDYLIARQDLGKQAYDARKAYPPQHTQYGRYDRFLDAFGDWERSNRLADVQDSYGNR